MRIVSTACLNKSSSTFGKASREKIFYAQRDETAPIRTFGARSTTMGPPGSDTRLLADGRADGQARRQRKAGVRHAEGTIRCLAHASDFLGYARGRARYATALPDAHTKRHTLKGNHRQGAWLSTKQLGQQTGPVFANHVKRGKKKKARRKCGPAEDRGPHWGWHRRAAWWMHTIRTRKEHQHRI